MTIEVLPKDIDDGEIGSPFCCPVALAASRAFPDKTVQVSTCYILLINTGEETINSFLLSSEVEDFIKAFDGKNKVYPFSFDI